jgi:hypothetical protein
MAETEAPGVGRGWAWPLAPRMATGAAVGLVVGGIWGAFLGLLGEELGYVLVIGMMAVSMAFAGMTVGLVRRWPFAVGALSGVLYAGLAPFLFFNPDGWIIIPVVACGASGLLCGYLTGCFTGLVVIQFDPGFWPRTSAAELGARPKRVPFTRS